MYMYAYIYTYKLEYTFFFVSHITQRSFLSLFIFTSNAQNYKVLSTAIISL